MSINWKKCSDEMPDMDEDYTIIVKYDSSYDGVQYGLVSSTALHKMIAEAPIYLTMLEWLPRLITYYPHRYSIGETIDLWPLIGKPVYQAAIIGYDGEVYTAPRPARHHTLISRMAKSLSHPIPITGKQGFILEDGTFLDRRMSKLHAIANHQLLDRASLSNELFSEDVW